MTRPLALFLALLALGGATLPPVAHAETPAATTEQAARVIDIRVDRGYHPDRIVVKAGERVRLRFTRTEYTGCTLEVVFPTLGVRAKLPTNEPVEVDLGTPAVGEIPFHCGMKMIHGTIAVQPAE